MRCGNNDLCDAWSDGPRSQNSERVEGDHESSVAGESASAKINARIAELGGWRGSILARVREVLELERSASYL